MSFNRDHQDDEAMNEIIAQGSNANVGAELESDPDPSSYLNLDAEGDDPIDAHSNPQV